MNNLNRLKHIATDLISNSSSGRALANNIEKFRMTLKNECSLKKEITPFKPRIQRGLNDYSAGTVTYEQYNAIINSIEISILNSIEKLKLSDVTAFFDYDDTGEIVYHFLNFDNESLYHYKGKLYHGKPHGYGRAKYSNGNFYEGDFKYGLKHGKGKFIDNQGQVLQGEWSEDEFIKKGAIKYFPNIKAAAGKMHGLITSSEVDFEYIKLPNLTENNLIAFPIEGDSMIPMYNEGDIIVCKEVLNKDYLVNDDVYVIYHDNELYIKFIQLIHIATNLLNFRLVSKNHSKHPPFEIIPNDTTKIYKIYVQINYKK